MNTAKLIKRIIPIAILLLAVGELMAQPGGGAPFGGGGPGCWPPPCVPIDGGMGMLLAAGIALGGKRLLDLRAK